MELTSYLILGLLIVISPGADFVLVLKNSLSRGRTAGVLTGIGIGMGVCIHITYSILGISHLLSQNMVIFNIIKYAGSAYLIYLGITGIFGSKTAFDAKHSIAPKEAVPLRRYFAQGFLCNMLNPKTMLFFLSVFSQLVSVDGDNSTSFTLLYGVYMSALHIIWFCLVAFLVTSESALAILHNAGHRINQACGFGLIAFGSALSLSN
ncbi:LysE family translocator [Vibrio viridaestus]|uniref:LysE family translocator n=1 Tax=Vibrio viridaestus TaxID=2487322 RepID=A0A3N9TAN6_9VIBR|nr:LysE family translocator [Vibrio viridaestus]RQW61109.1 LysE family translocator [Vibrio viridaestus]